MIKYNKKNKKWSLVEFINVFKRSMHAKCNKRYFFMRKIKIDYVDDDRTCEMKTKVLNIDVS